MPKPSKAYLSTGFDALDAALPGGGWPHSGLVEILYPEIGLGELSLLAPSLAALSQQQMVVLVRPPLSPYAPALAQADVTLSRLIWVSPKSNQDCWWVMETALRSTACGMVIAWPGRIPVDQVRRLQVSASEGQTLGVLMRPDGGTAPNVHLRLRIRRNNVQTCQVDIEKARGTHRRSSVVLPC
ncbi:MAG: translesion DNA synthesis-associated protein ImuA [Abyssibacter sp.]|nr:translesion DNA synthesis-associated protein ImuA [Abyssibacter sp.]